MQNLIKTDRLSLRPRSRDDLEACMAMDRDPSVTKYIDGPWHDHGLHRAFLMERMGRTYTYPFGYWSITKTETPGVFLGWVMALCENEGSSAEIGWRLTRESWGQGIATEAALGVLDAVVKKHPLIDVTASIHSENEGSIKVATKIGMTFAREEIIEGQREIIYERPARKMQNNRA